MYVYMIRCINRDNYVKIGVARNVESRLETLQTSSPYRLEVLASIRCNGRRHAYDLEKRLHWLFRKQRIRGEWFKKVDMKRASDYIKRDVEKQTTVPYSEDEWRDAKEALDARKYI